MTLPFDLPVATEEETAAAAHPHTAAAALPLYAYDQHHTTNTDDTLVIVAIGRPVTQGSKTRGRWSNYESNAKTLHPWRDTVTAAALAARADRATLEGPVEVHCWFYFDRPAGHYGTGRNARTLKPSAPRYPIAGGGQGQGDIDKLVRAVLDSLTVAKVFRDDTRVARIYAEKRWTGEDGMDLEGARLHIRELT